MTTIAPVVARRLALLTLALLIPSSLLIFGAAWLHGRLAEAREELVALRSKIERLDAAASTSKALAASTLSTASSTYTADFLPPVDDAVAQADLQNRLRSYAVERSVEFSTATPLPAKSSANATYLGLRVVMRGRLQDLQVVFHAIDNATPLLFTERVGLRLDPSFTDASGVPALIVEIDIYGARLPMATTQ